MAQKRDAFARAFRTLLWVVLAEVVGLAGVIVGMVFDMPVGILMVVLIVGAVAALASVANLLRAYFAPGV